MPARAAAVLAREPHRRLDCLHDGGDVVARREPAAVHGRVGRLLVDGLDRGLAVVHDDGHAFHRGKVARAVRGGPQGAAPDDPPEVPEPGLEVGVVHAEAGDQVGQRPLLERLLVALAVGVGHARDEEDLPRLGVTQQPAAPLRQRQPALEEGGLVDARKPDRGVVWRGRRLAQRAELLAHEAPATAVEDHSGDGEVARLVAEHLLPDLDPQLGEKLEPPDSPTNRWPPACVASLALGFDIGSRKGTGVGERASGAWSAHNPPVFRRWRAGLAVAR